MICPFRVVVSERNGWGGEKSRMGWEKKEQWRKSKGRKVRGDTRGDTGTVVTVY